MDGDGAGTVVAAGSAALASPAEDDLGGRDGVPVLLAGWNHHLAEVDVEIGDLATPLAHEVLVGPEVRVEA